MYDYILKEKEIIKSINAQLNDLKIFLVGDTKEKENNETNTKTPNCLEDDIIGNLESVDYALKQINTISAIIKGGNK